jgi:hypothetical protein
MNPRKPLGAILWVIASFAVSAEPAPASREPLGIAMRAEIESEGMEE